VGQNTIVNPTNDLAAPGFWNRDADIAILYGCSSLNNLASSLPNAPPPGVLNWFRVMRNGPRPLRMILGFRDRVSFAPNEFMAFADSLQEHATFINAWEGAMNRNDAGFTPRPYAIAFFEICKEESRHFMGPPPRPTDFIRYLFNGNPPNQDCFFGATNAQAVVRGSTTHSPAPARIYGELNLTNTLLLSHADRSGARYTQRHGSETISRDRDPASLVPTPLSPDAAAQLATSHLQRILARSNLNVDMRVSGISPRCAGRSGPDGSFATVTNGYIVYFEHYWQDVPIQGDGVSIDILGTEIVRTSASCHAPVASAEPDPSALLRPENAWREAQRSAKAGARFPESVPSKSAKLAYVKAGGGSEASVQRYVPAWKFEPDPRLAAPAEAPSFSRTWWIHAVTGQWLEEVEP
jgi:hypothetical protein